MSSLANVEIPVSESGSLYMSKWEQGANRIRVLGDVVQGYKWFPEDGSPPKHVKTPGEIETGVTEHKYFWMIPIAMNSEVKFLTFHQKTIMNQMKELEKSEEWGDPISYDITITRSGEGKETQYTIMPHPKADVDSAVVEKWQKLKTRYKPELLFTSGTPLEPAEEKAQDSKKDDGLPF